MNLSRHDARHCAAPHTTHKLCQSVYLQADARSFFRTQVACTWWMLAVLLETKERELGFFCASPLHVHPCIQRLLQFVWTQVPLTQSLLLQVHVGEYGVHWNFFFSLAVVAMLSSAVRVPAR